MEKKQQLIKKILDIELGWFQNIPATYPTACQESPDGFKLVRGSAYELWSEKTLKSYLSDLMDAVMMKRNLIWEKYAKLDGKMFNINEDPLIGKIMDIESAWTKEAQEEHPYAFRGGTVQQFRTYLRSELDGYSSRTLKLYFEDDKRAKDEGRNPLKESYILMFRKLGYNSLDELEEKIKREEGQTK